MTEHKHKDKIIRINKKHAKKIVWITLGAVALFFLGLVMFAYGFGVQYKSARNIGRALHLPAAFVGSEAISLSDYHDSYDLVARISDTPFSKNILQQMVENKVASDLAREQGIAPTPEDLKQAYEELILLTAENPETRYKISKDEFFELVLEPSLIHSKLATQLSANEEFNKDIYGEVRRAKQELVNGAKFEDLASKYSDDALSSKIGGDLGFVTARDLVPEYFSEVVATKDENVHTVATRHGLYLFKLVGRDQNQDGTRYRVKHIFFKTQDYDQWLKSEVKKRRVLKLV